MGVHDLRLTRLAPEAALAALGSGAGGLTAGEARRRLGEFGPNRVEAVKRQPLWLVLVRELTHFFALILWVAAGLALIAERFDPAQGMAVLAYAIVGVILINGGFSFWQTYRAERALEALRRLLPQRVSVRRDARSAICDADDLVPGDIVELVEGAKIPADCRILEAWSLRVNLATLTGESLPKARQAEAEGETMGDPLEAKCLLLAGTHVLAGHCVAVVYATGMQTELGRIAHLTQTAGEAESPLQKEIRRVSRVVALLATALGVAFFAIGHLIGLSFWANFMFAIGIIVANVPEGLLPTVTLALALATQRMAARNALVRRLPAVETLGSTTVILTDKTGTLTQNRMAVRETYAARRHHLAARYWPRSHDVHLRAVARYCHSLKIIDGSPSGDPMEIALWQFAETTLDLGRRDGEFPFDAERRRMSVITRLEDGSGYLWCKGAPESVMPLCATWSEGESAHPLDEQVLSEWKQAQENMADRGLRVLALAWKRLAPGEAATESGLELCGLVGLEDPPRPDVHAAIERCHAAGLRVIMVTGDHPHTALAIGREVGLLRTADPLVLTGDVVRRMQTAELHLALEAQEILFTRVTAAQKMLIVEALRRKGETVAVTGDGVNDAPALKAADIVLLDDHFATIVNAIEEGRAVFENIRKFMTYILTSNIPEIVPYLAFVVFRIPLPLTVIQILAIDLGTDMMPALALGAEPPDPDVMNRPPRSRSERLLSGGLLARAYLFLGPIEAAAALAAFFCMLHALGWSYGSPLGSLDPGYLRATTATLAAIVVMQVVNLFLCRQPLKPITLRGIAENPLIPLGLAVELAFVLAIVYLPLGNWLFATAPLPLASWLGMLLFAVAMVVLEELRKAFARRRARAGSGAESPG